MLRTLPPGSRGPCRPPPVLSSTSTAFLFVFLLPCIFLDLLLLYRECYWFERAFFTLSFFTLHSFPDLRHISIQSGFINVFLEASSSSLKATGSPFAVPNTDPGFLFLWISQSLPKCIALPIGFLYVSEVSAEHYINLPFALKLHIASLIGWSCFV